MKTITFGKAICTAMLISTPVSAVYARHLNPDEALSRITTNHALKRMPGILRYDLIHTEESNGGEMVYVFNTSENGFIVVSADDNMPALLGYSDNGVYDPDNISPALKWWISQYAEEASYALSSDTDTLSSDLTGTRSETERVPIPELLTTKWGQDMPFNLLCPELNGKRCVTGCVATAMAQIIKYHKYPDLGCNTNEYIWNGNTLTFDYGNTNFNYDLMENVYSGQESEEANNAVANLMYACGIAVNMNYDTEGSSASDTYISYALRHYFNYDTNIRLMKRDFFTADQWEELIYSELQQRRPVVYGGHAPRGGHQFICDGYDGNGFFHINWGWNGYGDGNFRLSALNPSYQGVGGFEGGYNSNQTIVCGIQPPVAGSEVWYPIYSDGSIEVARLNGDNSVTLKYNVGGLWNYSQQTVEVEMLLKAVAPDGKVYISDPYPFMFAGDTEPRTKYPFQGATGKNISGYTSFTLNLPKNLPADDYKCYMVIKTPEGTIQKVFFPITDISYFNLNVSPSGKITYSQGDSEVKAKIRVVSLEPYEPLSEGAKPVFKITIENIGDYDYYGTIEYRVRQNGVLTDETKKNIRFNSIQPGTSPTFIWAPDFTLEAASYDITFYDQYGDQISESFTFTIGNSGVKAIVKAAESIDVFSADGRLIQKNADEGIINSLPKGIFILKTNSGKTYKILR